MEAKEPWWASDPTIAAIRRGVLDEIEQAQPLHRRFGDLG
jgi:hypothetical protein